MIASFLAKASEPQTSQKAYDLTTLWNHLAVWEQTAIAVAVGFLLHLFVRIVLLQAMRRLAASTENDLDDRLVYFVRRFYLFLLTFGLFLVILRIHGIEITPFLASAGILGIAIGLAAKETLSDILAGVFLIADQPIRIGDRIKVESIGAHWGGWGDVVDVGLRRTKVRNTDGVIVNYPNNVLANSVITNFSFEDEPIRVRVRFQVNYDCDLELACEVARKAINSTAQVIDDSTNIVVRSVWDDHGGHMQSGILLEGRYRIDDVRDRTRIRSDVLISLTKALREHDIALASPKVRIEGS